MQQETVRKVILKEGYYLDNFKTLINYVKGNYETLLIPEELNFYNDFNKLTVGSQRLYVRLITRKGPFFRTDKLKYAEIESIDNCIYELQASGFLEINPENNLDFILQTITKPEIIDLVNKTPELRIIPKEILKTGKELIVQNLLEFEDIISEQLKQSLTFVYPLKQEIVTIYHLLFFGNTHQVLTDFILEDIGVLRYEPYQIRPEDRFFKDRSIIDGLFFLSNFKIELWEATESDDLEKITLLGEIIKSYPVPNQLLKKFSKVFNSIGRYLEKYSLWQEAFDFYNLSVLPPAKERKARIYDKIGKVKEALEIASSISVNPYDDYEAEFAEIFIPKLKKKLGIPIDKTKREVFQTKELILKKNITQNIEITALEAYFSKGMTGFYTENVIWKSLFGLAFWDIIFMSVPDVFFNPFQRGPSDLFNPDFKINRDDAISKRISKIASDPDWGTQIYQQYEKKYKTANLLVDWKYCSLEQIKKIIDWVPRAHIVEIFSRMCSNLGDFKTGFPDLMIFYPDPGQYLLVEVKGPGDQLHPNQKAWLRFFDEKIIPYEVAKIKWQTE